MTVLKEIAARIAHNAAYFDITKELKALGFKRDTKLSGNRGDYWIDTFVATTKLKGVKGSIEVHLDNSGSDQQWKVIGTLAINGKQVKMSNKWEKDKLKVFDEIKKAVGK